MFKIVMIVGVTMVQVGQRSEVDIILWESDADVHNRHNSQHLSQHIPTGESSHVLQTEVLDKTDWSSDHRH